MNLNFTIQLREDDYWDLKTRDLIEVIWQSTPAVEYLDSLDYPKTVNEQYLEDLSVYNVEASYTIDPHILDHIQSCWPQVFEPSRWQWAEVVA
jgi:hypothetical protein